MTTSFLDDFQYTSNTSAAVTSTSSQVVNSNDSFGKRRTQLLITNLSSTLTVTLAKGDVAVVAGSGITLLPNATYYESDDSGFNCWQGAVQAISTNNANLAIVQTFETRR